MPLDPKLTKYTTASPSIASFTFSELVSGLGFIKFFLAGTNDDTGTNYILTEQQIYSTHDSTRLIETVVNTDTTSTNTFLSSTFNLQRTASGTAILTIGFDFVVSVEGSITATLSKFDGTDTINLATAVVKTLQVSSRNGTWTFSMPLTETLFKVGDQLKLTILIDHNSAGGNFTAYGHDPQNRDGVNVTPSTNANSITSSNLLIPFKIDS